MDNMELWDAWHEVPAVAQKKIKGGRLAGMTDINPMWRIQQLTKQFGPCGIGWKVEIKRTWLEKGTENEVAALVELELFIKTDTDTILGRVDRTATTATIKGWSEPIPGIGGSKFVTNEKTGPYVSDEAYKMAYTDALSVCCKMLGMGADVYWEAGTKYTMPEVKQTDDNPLGEPVCAHCGKPITAEEFNGKQLTVTQIVKNCNKVYGGTMLHPHCAAAWKEGQDNAK